MPVLWEVRIDEETAAAVCEVLEEDRDVSIRDLLTDHTDRESSIPAVALLHENDAVSWSLPEASSLLKPGDRLLFAGTGQSRSGMSWTLQNPVALEYVLTGEVQPQTPVGRWLFGRPAREARPTA